MFLQILKLKSVFVLMLCWFVLTFVLTFVFTGPSLAQTEQTAEQAVQDVDAAYQALPQVSAPRKLFQAKTAPNKSTKSKSSKKNSRDFVEVHKSSKNLARKPSLIKSASKKSDATVDVNDLMDGMRESLNPNAKVFIPADVNAAPPAAIPAGQQIIKPLPSGKLFHPVAKAAEDALPAVTAKTSASGDAPKAAPTSLIDQPVKETAIKETAIKETAIKETAIKETAIKETKVEEPKKDAAKTGAPLLSDLSEPPIGAEGVRVDVTSPATIDKPVPDKKMEASAAPVEQSVKQLDAPKSESGKSVAGDSFAKPRPLFSSQADKRKRPGIQRAQTPSSSFSATSFAPAAELPPVAEPATKEPEPMIKPAHATAAAQGEGTDKSIWRAPNPELMKGKVLYTQTADEPNDTAVPTSPAAPEAVAEQRDNIKSVIDASCGSSNGVSVSVPPTVNLCGQGNPTTVIGSGPFMWTCQSTNGDKTVNCMASLKVNAVCGSADGIATISAPTHNLCRVGQASSVTGSGPFVWACAGSGGGVNDNCQAPLASTAVAENKTTPTTEFKDIAVPSKVETDNNTANDNCKPAVKRWTITCQQGGYPSSYTGVIVGETQTLCPTNVERGVWLSNSCAATDEMPVSKYPGKLETPAPSKFRKGNVTDMLPDIAPMPAQKLDAPRKLFTPHYSRGSASKLPGQPVDDVTTIVFAPTSEALTSQAVNAIEGAVSQLRGDDKSIITLNAYAAVPADGDQQESRRLALARALAVRSYMMRKGVPSNRIDVRAIGPASDEHGDDRVDIKIK